MRRILIVDDEAEFGRMLREYLEGTGRYQVRTEQSGLDAPASASDFKPDVILLDFMLRDCAGPRTAALIRERQDLARIPIIFVTVTSQDDSQGTIAGFPFIQKPVKLDEIEQKILKYI